MSLEEYKNLDTAQQIARIENRLREIDKIQEFDSDIIEEKKVLEKNLDGLKETQAKGL